MKKMITLLFFALISISSYSQNPEAKRANHWYFGNGAGLDFSSGSPVAVTDGALHTYEGCASISDTLGNLLFYTDGDTVWNKNHQAMPNGTGLYGCSIGSSTQSSLIIPHPALSNLYYLFTTDCAENLGSNGLRYSIINMSLDTGLGDVSAKNKLLYSPSTEKLTATYYCEKSTIWIMSHEYNSDRFFAYKIDENGLDTTPIISNIGTVHSDYYGCMSFSPNGKKLATTLNVVQNINELFDFNPANGKVTNPIKLPAGGGDYGVSFSPNSKILYFSANGNTIYQFDISSNIDSIIANSFNYVANTNNNNDFFYLALGTDLKLYASAAYQDSISYFSSPNNLGINSQINVKQLSLNNKESLLGLPNFIQSYFDDDTITTCFSNNKTNVSIPNVFSPNNDGINDLFTIKVKGYTQINYTIFNRWGNSIKSSSNQNITNTTLTLWDGKTTTGDEVSDGVYYYIINLTWKGGKQETKKGFIQLYH